MNRPSPNRPSLKRPALSIAIAFWVIGLCQLTQVGILLYVVTGGGR